MVLGPKWGGADADCWRTGLAAPALAPLLAGTLGLTFFGTAGGAVLIGTLLGLGGGAHPNLSSRPR